jgi:hypothetical protein
MTMNIKGTKLPLAPQNEKFLAGYKGKEPLILVETLQSFMSPVGDLPWRHCAILPESVVKKLDASLVKVIGPYKAETVAVGEKKDEGGKGKAAGADEQVQASPELAEVMALVIDAEDAKDIIYDETVCSNKLVKEWATLLKINFGPTDPVKGIREQVFAAATAKFN